MRKLLFAFCALMFSAAASAQIETKIVGVWSVDSVTENKDLKLNNKETNSFSLDLILPMDIGITMSQRMLS